MKKKERRKERKKIKSNCPLLTKANNVKRTIQFPRGFPNPRGKRCTAIRVGVRVPTELLSPRRIIHYYSAKVVSLGGRSDTSNPTSEVSVRAFSSSKCPAPFLPPKVHAFILFSAASAVSLNH